MDESSPTPAAGEAAAAGNTAATGGSAATGDTAESTAVHPQHGRPLPADDAAERVHPHHAEGMPVPTDDETPSAWAWAKDLVIHTGGDHRVGPLTFELHRGPVAVIGRAGSGKTVLLTTLSGRMTGVSGELMVDGMAGVGNTRTLRRQTSVARLGDYVSLEDGVTVGDAIVERRLLEGVKALPAEAAWGHAAGLIGLTIDHRDRIGELLPLVRAKLALALACIPPSALIVFDDLAHGLNVDEQVELWRCVLLISADGTPVVASTTEATTVPEHVRAIDLAPPLVPHHTDPSLYTESTPLVPAPPQED